MFMKKKMLLALTLTAVVALLAGPAHAGDLQAASRAFLAAHPGAKIVADPAGAPRAFVVNGFRTAPVAGDPVIAARRFALDHAALLGLDHPSAGLELTRVSPHRADRFYQFVQTLHGLEVFHAPVIVGVDGAGRIFRLASRAVTGAVPAAAPRIGEAAAEASAARGIAGVGPAEDVALGWIESAGRARLVWRVLAPAPGPHRWVTYVDARTGAVAFREDLVRGHQANVFPENPVVDDETTAVVELPNLADDEPNTRGALAVAATCASTDAYGTCQSWVFDAVADENDFLDIVPDLDAPTASPDPFAEVSAYYYLDDQSAWMRDEFGFAGQYADPELSEDVDWVWAMVNVDMANAMWAGGGWGDSPDMIIIGQGVIYASVVDFAYDADVISHEFTHSVSTKAFQVGLGNLDELGVDMTIQGVEEGNADYFAVSHHGNSKLSEYALGISGRDADNDHTCPDDLMGESHYDGEIIVGLLWELRAALGAEKVDHLEYATLAGTGVSTFGEYAAALLATAEDMTVEGSEPLLTGEDVEAVGAVIEARGIGDCERVVDLWIEGAGVQKIHYATFDITDGQGTPSAVQYRIRTEETTQVLRLQISPQGDDNYDVLMRAGGPVTFAWDMGGYPFSWEAEFDGEWEGSSSVPITEVKISNATEIAIAPGAEYYFSIICRPTVYGCQSYVTAELSDTPEDVEEDAGPDADADADTDADTDADAGTGGGSADDGCGCSAAGAEPGGILSALASLI